MKITNEVRVKITRLFLQMITCQIKPFRMETAIGMGTAVVGFIYVLYIIINKYKNVDAK